MKTLVLALLLIAGCTHHSHQDAAPDSGISDSGVDSGTADSDAGVLDSGASQPDAAMPPQAGMQAPPVRMSDAGQAGGPAPQAGHSSEAGSPAAGSGGMSAAGSGGSYATGAAGSSGSIAQAGAGGQPAVNPCVGPPGLYDPTDTTCTKLASGVRPYTTQYPLWTDGAVKTRYVYLPAGAKIDASDPDHWRFPVGTRLYKEFDSADGKTRVEIRYLEKVADTIATNGWVYDTYVFSADQKTMSVQRSGVINALGTGLDVPSQALCLECHNHSGMSRDMSNGFQAIQLNHAGTDVTLQTLIQEGALSGAKSTLATDAVVPGRNATETAAFGWYHGNCGHCHSAKVDGTTPTYGDDSPHSLALQTVVGYSLALQPVWLTTVCVFPHTPDASMATQRIAPGNPTNSAIWNRDRVRGPGIPSGSTNPHLGDADAPTGSIQMPPIGTNVVDAAAIETARQWIQGLSVGVNAAGKCVPN